MTQTDLDDLFSRVNHNLKLLELIDFIMTYSVNEITKYVQCIADSYSARLITISCREALPEERIWLIRTDAMRAVFCLFNNYDEAADMVSRFISLAIYGSIDNWVNFNRSFHRFWKYCLCTVFHHNYTTITRTYYCQVYYLTIMFLVLRPCTQSSGQVPATSGH